MASTSSNDVFDENIHAKKLLSCLNEQRLTGRYCDIHLKIADHLIPIHSCILSACSLYFRGIFERLRLKNSSFLFPQILELDVPGMIGPLVGLKCGGLEAIQDILTYIYTGKIDFVAARVEIVVQVADVMMLDDVSKMGREFLKTKALCTKTVLNQSATNFLVRQAPVGTEQLEPVQQNLQKPTINPIWRHHKCGKHRLRQENVLKNISQQQSLAYHGDDESEEEEFKFRPEEIASRKVYSLPKRCKTTYKCKQCPFVSKNSHEIHDHRKVHCGKAYICTCCGFIAERASELLRHMFEAQLTERVCSLCGFEANDRMSFKEHLVKHNDRKPFFCTTCGLRFRTRTTLSVHLPKHTAGNPKTFRPSYKKVNSCKSTRL